MPKQKIVLCLVLFFAFCFRSELKSQVGVSKITGCVPLEVDFTAPPGSSSWNWSFGNGSSPAQNPSNVYNTPGTYNVTYSGTGGSPTYSMFTIIVTANNINPSFSFNLPPSRCTPMSVSFSGTSSGGGSVFSWAFGDGGIAGPSSSVNYVFTIGGVFNPTLAVTDPVSGCTGTVSNGPINVSTPANLVIDANPGLTSCIAPFTTALTGTNSTSGSPLGTGLTYNWNFGNSQTSTQATPGNVTYANQGYFNLALSVTDDNNCTSSTTVVVSVIQPTLSATVPSSLCIFGQEPYIPRIFTTSFQSSVPSVIWDMGNGSPPFSVPTSAGSFTFTDYNTPGPHTVSATASVGNCIATFTQVVFSEQITPQFTDTPGSFTCSPTMQVSYINQSTINCNDPLSYSWKVPWWDGLGNYLSTSTNPTFVIKQAGFSPYTYYFTYKPTAELIVSSSLGCSASVMHIYDSILRPTAWFNKNKRQGCAPLTVNFRDSSFTNTTLYPIQSYTWNNGANPAQVVSNTIPPPMAKPTFTYAAGTYTPFLIIETAGGCIDTSFVDTIIVVNTPTIVSNISSNLSVCAGQTLQIDMSALPSSADIQHWHVTTDDGFFSGCVTNPDPIWVFTHLGVHNFTLSAYDHSCESSIVPPQTVTVKGPLVACRYQTNCGLTTRKKVDFTSSLQQVQTATLNFGDNTPVHLISGNPTGNMSDLFTHTYASTGDYTATLIGANSATGCGPYTFTTLVTVREIAASFTVPAVVCSGGNIPFDASASVDVLTGCDRGYAWLFDNARTHQTSAPVYSQTFTAPGVHTASLVVKDLNSCLAIDTHTFLVDAPAPSFTCPNPACPPDMPVQFVNTTPVVPGDPKLFFWDFGASPSSTIIVNDNSTQTYNYLYINAPAIQFFTVSLTATSTLYGCTSTTTLLLQVDNPPTQYIFTNPSNYACINKPMQFVKDTYTNTVDFGDGSPTFTTAAATLSHIYTTVGHYSATVLYTDAAGCTSSAFDTVYVLSPPSPSFSFFPSANPNSSGAFFCAPVSISFSSSAIPTPDEHFTYTWNLGTGSPVVSHSVVGNLYTSPGTETITLKISNQACSSTQISTLTVLGPTATAVIGKQSFCLGETIQLSMKDSSQILGWNWFFGNGSNTGTVLANSMPTGTLSYPYTYFPPPNGQAVINLVYFSYGYLCPQTSTIGIQVNVIDAQFNRNAEAATTDSAHCLNLTDQFNNTSKKNNNAIISSLYFNWQFGDGGNSNILSPAYTYSLPGVYNVTLTVVDPIVGCKDMTTKSMTIFPLPSSRISLPDSVCQGSSFMLSSTSSSDATTFLWQPVTGLVNPTQANTSGTASVSTTYSLIVGNQFGCRDTTNSEFVYIQPPAPKVKWDTTIVIGQPAILNTNLGTNFTYTWSPLTNLSCEQCLNPVSTTTANFTYSVTVEDKMGCFRVVNSFTVNVDPETSLDVPTAFTPNGDGVNDIIYVGGWGIKKLNYFRVFNRWGELLFESTDLKVGWDGTFKGVPQNMDNYVYQASVEGYIPGVTLNKTSSFRLIH